MTIDNTETFDLSIIEVNKNKVPKGMWKEYQHTLNPISNWFQHFDNGGYVGLITGSISRNLEVIDIDSKNDPTNRIIGEYTSIIPKELYDKLVVVSTPSGGQHFYFRCDSIEGNQVLAKNSDNRTIIETRGEGGYVCFHQSEYPVIQGVIDLSNLTHHIQTITNEERDLLFTLARSLDRSIQVKITKQNYSEESINRFNLEFPIINLFQQNNWTVQNETDEKVFLLRPNSISSHSGVYFKRDKVFFCFSTSTDFKVARAYNHFQIIQIFKKNDDYRSTLRELSQLGYPSSNKNDTKNNKITDHQILDFCHEKGVRYNTFIQEVTINGKILDEMDNNTLFIELKKHFDQEVSRSAFENVIKSHFIEKEDPIDNFIKKHEHKRPTNAIQQWVDCLNLRNKNVPRELITHFMTKWYVGLIAQCLDGEYSNEFFIAILSTKQGVGKTTLLRNYTIPKDLQPYRKEVSIQDDEDFKLLMSQAILIIDDEMDGRTLNADKTFKSMLSRKDVSLRKKYDRRHSTLVRRCSFAGCGNQINVVRERQNRRIIPIEITSIDYEKVKLINPDDMFIEAYHLYTSGYHYSYNGSDADKINQLSKDYLMRTDLDEIVEECINKPNNESDLHPITAIQLINALCCLYPNFTKKLNNISIGKILADMGIESKRVGSKKRMVYMVSKSSKIISTIEEQEYMQNQPLLGFTSPANN